MWETSLKLSFLAFPELKEALDNLDVPEDKVRRTWGHRTEKSDTNWEEIRSELEYLFLQREQAPQNCYVCGNEGTIVCLDCNPHTLCESCDLDVHKNLMFHDRKWFRDYHRLLSPLQGIEHGEIIQIGINKFLVIHF